ncbi:MAG: prolyl oligopeptidase family serine peptidase [Anaerolineales bacterium]|nr:prolyl oligopeptidase family serine peptidase [Anaerolineales bacterium]
MHKTPRQFGLWDSPITPLRLSRGISFSDVAWDDDGSLLWLERRADRGVIVVQPINGEALRDLNSEYGVRGKVGYGGGDFTVRRGQVYFADASSGRLYRQPLPAGQAVPLTPAFGAAASPVLSPDGRWLLYVHTYEDVDRLALVDGAGAAWPVILASGQDFYMQPCWHPESQQVAWVAWNHPNMPWDGTQLFLGTLSESVAGLPRLKESFVIAGDQSTSVFQPQFSPDGRYLAYVSDQSGWWQLYLYDLTQGAHRQLTHLPAEHAEPAWTQGVRTYGFAPDGKSLFFQRIDQGFVSLWELDLERQQEQQIPLPGYTCLSQLAVSPNGERIALLADGGAIPPRLIACDRTGRVQVVRRGTAEDLHPSTYSQPQHISWAGMDGEQAYGLYYPPHHDSFEGVELPPLVVMIHGGPTSQRFASFYIAVQFFTSRGYAVLDVNYRGSTGYGRAYRNKLRGNWGIFDVQDAVSGARALVEQGQVDGKRLVIMGGSAGGYTVLQALEDYPGFFKTGICLYGISNQFTAAADTHKFEAHYSDSLLGPLPQAAELYRQRSPIYFTDRITDPLLVFQGEEDNVVPRAQSDEIVAALRRQGVPHEYHLYPGEGHGFRKAESIEHMYRTIEKFLRQVVIFS